VLHQKPAGVARGLQVSLVRTFGSLCNILQDLLLKRQVSHQFLQPAILPLQPLQRPRLPVRLPLSTGRHRPGRAEVPAGPPDMPRLPGMLRDLQRVLQLAIFRAHG